MHLVSIPVSACTVCLYHYVILIIAAAFDNAYNRLLILAFDMHG